MQKFGSFAHSASWPGQANMIVNMIGQWQEGKFERHKDNELAPLRT